MKNYLNKMISLAIALVLIVSLVPISVAVNAAETTLPEEMKNGTVVWDLENAPADLEPWSSDKFADWGADSIPNFWAPTTAEGKGVNGSKALAWQKKTNDWGSTSYLTISNDNTAVTDWTGATEFMFYIDASAIGSDMPVDVGLNDSDLGKSIHKGGAAWYLYENGAWSEKAINDWGHMVLPAGYVGFVRVPFAALEEAPANLASVTKISFYLEVQDADLGDTVYFDNFTINVASETPDDGDQGETPDEPKREVPAEVENGTVVWDVENTGSLDGKLTNFFKELWPDNTDATKGDLSTDKMAIEIAEGKGFKGSAALKFQINEPMWGQLYYVGFDGDKNAVTNWSGAKTLYFWIDNTGTGTDNPVDIFLTSDGSNHLIKDAAWATFENGQWVDRKINEWGHMIIPANYVGWVKLPLATMGHSADLSKVERIAIYTEKPGAIYLDHFVIDVADSVKTGDTAVSVFVGFMGISALSLAVLVLGKKKFHI